ncbi:MAG TPA: hypothetical protein DCP92_09200, partial [Nitrospiraceae bacterium]|nr:hypothetical protein [Nitrospiraceae bacterium]
MKRKQSLRPLTPVCLGLIACVFTLSNTAVADDAVAPEPSEFWHAPDLSGYTRVLKPAEQSPIDPQKRYDLVELIDLAQRLNPETRAAWEAARQAAIGVGLV